MVCELDLFQAASLKASYPCCKMAATERLFSLPSLQSMSAMDGFINGRELSLLVYILLFNYDEWIH